MSQSDFRGGMPRLIEPTGVLSALLAALLLGARPIAVAAQRAGWSTLSADSLVQFGREDQQGRTAVGQWVASDDTAAIRRVMVGDSARSQWLRRAVSNRGWPTAAKAGADAAHAAWVILQHSPFEDWQNEMLPTLERLAENGDLARPEFATLTDRVLVHRGEPQRYGSQFDIIDGRLMPARIANPAGLEQRRKAMGLPPMAEYARMLGEMYKLPVVWPPPP